MVLVQKWPMFEPFVFWQYRPGKYLLRYSRKKKTPFKAIKTKSSKTRKLHSFPKGFLVKKWRFFQLFLLPNIGQKNILYDILERKNAFQGYKNKKFKKSKNWHFSKGVNPCFRSKNDHFSDFFFRQYRAGKYLLRYSRTIKRLSSL